MQQPKSMAEVVLLQCYSGREVAAMPRREQLISTTTMYLDRKKVTEQRSGA